MPVSDSSKLDYLWKKVGYGVTKTAPATNKEAFNESIPSPLIYRGDLVMTNSGDIPAVLPTTSSAIVEVYKDNAPGNSWTSTVECTEDLTAPDNQTWKTNLANWIPTQFGSTYLVKVYVDNPGATAPQTTGVQLFQAGSGNNDEWFFDYQSGVLNFNGANIPSVIGTGVTGKTVYISGARYVGPFGVGASNNLGNLSIANTTITTDGTIANITIEPTGNGVAIIDATTGLVLPAGNTAQRPDTPAVGTIRYSTTSNQTEFWNGSAWINGGTSNVINATDTATNAEFFPVFVAAEGTDSLAQANANITINPFTGVFTSKGLVTTGTTSTGNITGAFAVVADYFHGDGSNITNVPPSTFIEFGNTVVDIPTSGGNVLVSVAATHNWVFDNLGNLTLPSNTASINYANGVNILNSVPAPVAEASFTVETADFSAVSGSRYGINVASGNITATLPASPSTGDAVFFADASGYSASNLLNINSGLNSIMGGGNVLTVSTPNQSVGLFWNGITWRTY